MKKNKKSRKFKPTQRELDKLQSQAIQKLDLEQFAKKEFRNRLSENDIKTIVQMTAQWRDKETAFWTIHRLSALTGIKQRPKPIREPLKYIKNVNKFLKTSYKNGAADNPSFSSVKAGFRSILFDTNSYQYKIKSGRRRKGYDATELSHDFGRGQPTTIERDMLIAGLVNDIKKGLKLSGRKARKISLELLCLSKIEMADHNLEEMMRKKCGPSALAFPPPPVKIILKKKST